jgi:hypothetical protein
MNEHGSNFSKWDQNIIEFHNVKGEIRMIKIICLRVTLGSFSSTDLPSHQIGTFDDVTKILSMRGWQLTVVAARQHRIHSESKKANFTIFTSLLLCFCW